MHTGVESNENYFVSLKLSFLHHKIKQQNHSTELMPNHSDLSYLHDRGKGIILFGCITSLTKELVFVICTIIIIANLERSLSI